MPKKKHLSRDNELKAEGLAPTLEELERESDLSRLRYLESITRVQKAEVAFEDAKEHMKYASGVFNEATCRYMAAKLKVEREPNRDVRKAFAWTVDAMTYAK